MTTFDNVKRTALRVDFRLAVAVLLRHFAQAKQAIESRDGLRSCLQSRYVRKQRVSQLVKQLLLQLAFAFGCIKHFFFQLFKFRADKAFARG